MCGEKKEWKTKTQPEQNIQKLWDNFKRYNIHVTGISGKKKKQKKYLN